MSKPSCTPTCANSFLLRSLTALMAVMASDTASAGQPQWFMTVGGLSHHFQETQAAGRTWQSQHPGLGLERRSAGPDSLPGDWSMTSMAGVMEDSRGFWGGYAGVAYQRHWKRSGVAEFGVGLGGYGLYRSVSWSGRMSLVPALMPVASVHFPQTGINLNLAYLPRMDFGGRPVPSVLHLKFGFSLP